MKQLKELSEQLNSYPYTQDALDNETVDPEVIGVGSARVVLQHPTNPNAVVKIPVGRAGYVQNKSEISVYECAEERGVSERLVPVLDYGEDWLTMPYVQSPEGPLSEKFIGPSAEYIYRELKEAGIILTELESTIVDKSAKAYDYGSVDRIHD